MSEYFTVPALPPAPEGQKKAPAPVSSKKNNPSPAKPVAANPANTAADAPADSDERNLLARRQAGKEIEARYNFLFRQDYDFYRKASLDAKKDEEQLLAKRKQLRNEILSKLMVVIDNHFYEFEAQLTGGRAWTNLASNLAVLGLNAAGAVVGGAEIKAILAATAAGVQGTELAIDKRMFQEQGPYLIVSYMRANRMECKVRIRKRMLLDDSQYSLDDGLSDMVEYFNSGTVISALNLAMADAENRKKDSVKQLQRVYDELLEDSQTAQFLATHQREIEQQALKFSNYITFYARDSGNNMYNPGESAALLGGDLIPIAEAFDGSDEQSEAIKKAYREFTKKPDDIKSLSGLSVTGYLGEGSSVVCSRTILYGAEKKAMEDVYTLRRDESGKWRIYGFRRNGVEVSSILESKEQ